MLPPELIAEFAAIVGAAHVHSQPAQLLAYSYDGTFQQRVPDLAVTPGSTEEVAAVVRLCARERLPMIPRGAGSGLAGGTIPVSGGVVISLTRLDRILEIDRANRVAVAEAGVVTARLQAEVEAVGLFYPPDPASLNQSTLGGNAACNSGGPRCFKYGVTKDYVLGLTVVLADGRILRCGGKVLKNATSYQLTQLFVGSEGTLGVITELILRLRPLPRVRSTALALFERLDDASATVTAIVAAGILPATLELMDGTTIGVVEDYLGLGLPRAAEALLILEQDGNDEEVTAREVERMAALCREHGAVEVRIARTPAERNDLWQARRAVSPALGRLRPNKLGEDVTVPPAAVPALIQRVRAISEEVGLPIPVFGHAGDGNLHPNILFDRRRPGELGRVERAATAIFRAALALGGTLSGEHGIGTLKRDFMVEDVGPVGLDVMRAIKRALDPQGLLNPLKKLPPTDEPARSGFLSALPSMEGIIPDTGHPAFAEAGA
ncbi:MAG: FAD-binding protein [Chloroflexi bacterium]|nr:FAD-binding protein [Chloroflexota bacterium]